MTNKIVTFGELLLRFSKPEHMRLTQADFFTSKYGGSEANVAVSLASLGDHVEYVESAVTVNIAAGCNTVFAQECVCAADKVSHIHIAVSVDVALFKGDDYCSFGSGGSFGRCSFCCG